MYIYKMYCLSGLPQTTAFQMELEPRLQRRAKNAKLHLFVLLLLLLIYIITQLILGFRSQTDTSINIFTI